MFVQYYIFLPWEIHRARYHMENPQGSYCTKPNKQKKTFKYVYLEVFQWILIENIFSLKYLLTPNRALGNPLETLT